MRHKATLWLFLTVFTVSIRAEFPPSQAKICVSGDISGFREARELFSPKGGMEGVLKRIEECQLEDGGVRLLTGNNLGREVRAGSQAPPSARRPGQPAEKYFHEWLKRIQAGFRGLGGVPPRCGKELQVAVKKDYQDPALARQVADQLEICDNDLMWLQLSKGFTAVALGEGDINSIDLTKTFPPALSTPVDIPEGLKRLRQGPFLANNLFFAQKAENGAAKKANIKIVLEKGQSTQAPYDPLKLKILGGIQGKTVEIKPQGSQGWVLRVELKEPCIAKSLWALKSRRVEITHQLPSQGKCFNKGTVTLDLSAMQPPLPLLPNSTYRVKLDSETLEVETFQSFTQTSATVNAAFPNRWSDWVEPGIPIIRPTRHQDQLRIVSILDEATEQLLDLPEIKCGNNGLKICRLRVMPMKESLQYWQKVLDYLFFKKAVSEFAEYAAKGFGKVPTRLQEVLKRSKGIIKRMVKANPERLAWQNIERWTSGQLLPLDWQVASIGQAVEASAARPALIVLAQTGWENIDGLSRDIDKVALWIGARSGKMVVPPANVEGPSRGLKVISGEFAEQMASLDAVLKGNSDWRISSAATRVIAVKGHAPSIVWAKTDPDFPSNAHPMNARTLELMNRALDQAANGSADPVAEDKKHLDDVIHEAARREAKTEAAILDNGVLGSEPLEWLRFLEKLKSPQRLQLGSVTLKKLSSVPGITDEDARIIISGTFDEQELKAHLKQRHGSDDVFNSVRWFIAGAAPNGQPQIYQHGLEWLMLTRIAFTQDKLKRVTVTEDTLSKIADGAKGDDLLLIGFSKVGPDKKYALHGIPLKGGKRPTVSVFTSRTGRRKGKVEQLDSPTSQFEDVPSSYSCFPVHSGSRRQVVTLRELVCHWIIDETLLPKPIDDAIAQTNKAPWWTFGVKQIDLGFTKSDVTDGFAALEQDSRTEAKDQRIFNLNPEFQFGIFLNGSPFGGTTDWTTTASMRFQETRISELEPPEPGSDDPSTEKIIVNQPNDEWKVRTQFDFYGPARRHALFAALDFRHQLKAKFMLTKAVIHEVPRNKEVNIESGYLYTNNDNFKFQVGATVSRNFERVSGFTVNDMFFEVGEPFENALLDADKSAVLKVVPITGRGTDYGLAFSFEWSHKFNKEEDGTAWAVSSKLTDGNLFFASTGVETFRPQVRFLWKHELTIPLFGNLFLVPSIEHYFLRIRPEDAGENLIRNFNQVTTGIKFRYALDFKPMFQTLKNALNRNRPDAK